MTRCFLTIAAASVLFAASSLPALAVPVTGLFTNDPTNCDNPAPITLSHELGPTALGFPINEGLIISSTIGATTNHFSCTGDDGVPNDFEITITNVSGIEWENLFFVADQGANFSNFDGTVDDLAFLGPSTAESFRIDGTVTAGVNNPLASESITNDEILELGETWVFTVDNFNIPALPIFGSIGRFADSSAIGIDTVSNASILATPVPEPAAMSVFSLAILATLKRKRN